MAHTALQKAIEQISEYRNTFYGFYHYEVLDKVVEQLTDLLPYERETIEAAYGDAIQRPYLFENRNDYFTKTYNQND
jgi:hypothetical protein